MSPNKADETSYLWENIPKELWTAARQKALSAGEGGKSVPLKVILRELLEGWVHARTDTGATTLEGTPQ